MSETGDGTLGKALQVLDQVAAFGRPVRFAELLADAPFPKATLYRFVQTLTNQGMLNFDSERQTYAPGIRLVRLAHAAWAQSTLAPIARPHIDALAADLVHDKFHISKYLNEAVNKVRQQEVIKLQTSVSPLKTSDRNRMWQCTQLKRFFESEICVNYKNRAI